MDLNYVNLFALRYALFTIVGSNPVIDTNQAVLFVFVAIRNTAIVIRNTAIVI